MPWSGFSAHLGCCSLPAYNGPSRSQRQAESHADRPAPVIFVKSCHSDRTSLSIESWPTVPWPVASWERSRMCFGCVYGEDLGAPHREWIVGVRA